MPLEAALAAGIPIVVVVVSGTIAMLSYARQKRRERLEDLRSKRRDVYARLLGTFPFLKDANQSAHAEYQKLKAEVVLFGSDESLKSLKGFARLIEVGGVGFSDDSATRLKAYAKLLEDLRRDVFPETRLTAEDLERLTPFGEARTPDAYQ